MTSFESYDPSSDNYHSQGDVYKRQILKVSIVFGKTLYFMRLTLYEHTIHRKEYKFIQGCAKGCQLIIDYV